MNDPYRTAAMVPVDVMEPFEPQGDVMSEWKLGRLRLKWSHQQGESVELSVATSSGSWATVPLEEEEVKELALMLQRAAMEARPR